MNKKANYGIAIVIINILFGFSLFVFFIYLIAPLINGKLSFRALIAYASLAVVALAGRFFLKKLINEKPIRKLDYIVISLAAIANLLIWFSYPMNIILVTLSVIGFVSSYKARKHHHDEDVIG